MANRTDTSEARLRLASVPDPAPDQPEDLPPGWHDVRADFVLGMRAAGRSPATIATYLEGLDAFARWFAEHAPGKLVEHATRSDLRAFLVSLTDRGLKPNSVATRHRALRAFYKFLCSEEVIAANPMASIPAPAISEERTPPALTVEQVDAMVKACRPRSSFTGARDRALLLLIASSGLRSGEALALTENELHLDSEQPYVTVRRAKGGRVREAAVSHEAALAIRHYLRQRRTHRHAHRPELWLSRQGPMTSSGLLQMVTAAAERVGLDGVHVHALRHSACHGMLARGMPEHSVMTQLGWTSPKQLGRYGKARATERSRDDFFRSQER